MAERETVFSLASIGTPARGKAEPRQMPHNADAEQGLLGALLIDNRAFEKVSDFLKPEHFYAPAHGRIFGIIAKLIERARDPQVKEVLLALNATVEGQSTAHYLTDQLVGANVTVSRLAHGVPIGGELDYLDEGTLAAAVKARKTM